MNPIVCPFCHACLVCPEYENVLASEEATDAHAKQLADVDA